VSEKVREQEVHEMSKMVEIAGVGEVIARVGEDSRRMARTHVHKLMENLEREKQSLIQEKREIELKISEVQNWKSSETSKILMKRLDKTSSIELTTALESQFRAKRAPLMRDKVAIEKRLHDINTMFTNQGNKPREDVIVLLRIETLLAKILSKLSDRS
jgi:translation initiation factor IF-2